VAYPDTCVGTDSHTTMINGLGVLGWGVGGIEAEAAMLGQPISMLMPEVIGFRLTGKLKEGVTATDLVLTVTQMLRKKGVVVGKFVEFYGPGLDSMTLADRATIGNMGPEYGATCGFFPVDGETIRYLTMSGREPTAGSSWSKPMPRRRACGARPAPPTRSSPTRSNSTSAPVVPSMAGPKRPEGRIALEASPNPASPSRLKTIQRSPASSTTAPVEGEDYDLGHGDVAIAAITSCTNTSNPSVLIGAGLLARNAVEKGLKTKPWVKTSLAPGSQVVADYLEKSGLQDDLDALGFNLVGFGCTTCIGNSGPLPDPISKAINDKGLSPPRVLSGNRNFEGRVSPDVQANYLASPPLVVAYALAGSGRSGPRPSEPLGEDKDGNPVYLKDIWPSAGDPGVHHRRRHPRMFKPSYADVFKGDENWQAVEPEGQTYAWDDGSTYVQNPPYFEGMGKTGAGSPTSSAPACSACSATRSRPTTSRRPARSRDSPRLGSYLMERHGVARGRLQPVRLAPRQPRSHDARHLRQHPHPQPHRPNGPKAATPSITRPARKCRSTTRP
jgi:aconitate hydratase